MLLHKLNIGHFGFRWQHIWLLFEDQICTQRPYTAITGTVEERHMAGIAAALLLGGLTPQFQ